MHLGDKRENQETLQIRVALTAWKNYKVVCAVGVVKLMTVVGLDLAGAQTRPTGFCKLVEMHAETALLYLDEEILLKVQESLPKVVAVDAPLSLPPGRKSIEERTSEHLREADRELLRRGIKFFPITLGPMRKLTERGMRLKATLKVQGYCVVEAYPGGAQDILGIPRKQRGLDKLRAGLEALGITGLCDGLSDHELDAATCALVAKMYVEGEAVTYGDPKQGIVMPPGDKPKPKTDV
jgi:predicted nuclease with RNAse H fold